MFLARLDPVSGAPDYLNANPNGMVRCLALQNDGKIIAGGEFTNIGGQVRHRVARLDPVTGLADDFDPNADSFSVLAIAVQADGKILIGGSFARVRELEAPIPRSG